MKRWVLILGIVVAGLLVYAAGPVLALKDIVNAVAARDAVALTRKIDTTQLKRSLLDQVGRAYLRVTGKDKGLSPLEVHLAVRVASIAAGERVDEMLKGDALIELLGSTGATEYSNLQVGAPRLEAPNLRNFFRIVVSTEYSGRRFSIIMPIGADDDSGYRIHLRFQDWEWKMVGIDLPAAVQTKIANQIIGAQEQG